MVHPGAVIADFLFKWSQEKYILLRLRVIMEFLALLYFLLYLLSVMARVFSWPTWSFHLPDVVTDTILMYVLGAMQAAPVRYPLFPLWALALVNFRSAGGILSGTYAAHFELKNVVKLLAVAYMNVTQGTKIGLVPFWIFWSLLTLKCLYRIWTRHRASKSLWNSRSSELLQAYMGPDQPQSNFVDNTSSPNGAMDGCKYLVYGEQCCRNSTSEQTSLNIHNLSSLITLQDICQSNELRAEESSKDVCLAFALSRLLRCRLERETLHAGTVSVNQKLIGNIIHNGEARQLFHILEMDVGFLKECLFTSYPMVFSEGFLSLSSALVLSLLKFIVTIWFYCAFGNSASRRMNREYKTSGHRKVDSFASDLFIGGIAIFITLVWEELEVLKYLFSKWTKLLVVCRLVNCSNQCMRYLLRKMLPCTTVLPSTNLLQNQGGDQYVFLQSFNYSAQKWKCLHSFTMGMVSSKDDGTKLITSNQMPPEVKTLVFEVLKGPENHPCNLELCSLPRDFAAPLHDNLAEQYWSKIQTAGVPGSCSSSRIVLVWHIATSLCEIKLAQDHRVDLSIPGFLRSALSSLSKYRSRYRGFLVDKKLLDTDLWNQDTVANWLSRYCAYLLVSKPDLLPGSIWVTKRTFQSTVQSARQLLHGCDSLKSKYDKLVPELQEAVIVPDTDEGSKILRQGARLTKKLINHEGEDRRWEILAKVWACLLVHLSPSSNAQAHAKYLESNYSPESITIVWALFSHCSIDKSELWDVASSDLVPGPSEQYTNLDNIRL